MNAITTHPKSRARRLVSLLMLGMLLVTSSAFAQTYYLGKLCFTFTITERQTGPVSGQAFTAKLDTTFLGGDSYAFNGYVSVADDGPFVVTGSGVMVGTVLYINFHGTQKHTSESWRDTGTNQTQLDLSTLSGTFYEVGHDYDPVGKTWDSTRFTAGTVRMVTCP